MNVKKMKRHPLRWILLAVVAATVAAGCVFSRYGGFGTGPSADADEFAQYAQCAGSTSRAFPTVEMLLLFPPTTPLP